MYAKAHPFGYKKVATPVDPIKNFRMSRNKKNRQTVKIDCPYEVTERKAHRDENGKLVFEPVCDIVTKGRKTTFVPRKKTYHNTITRHIVHYQ